MTIKHNQSRFMLKNNAKTFLEPIDFRNVKSFKKELNHVVH